MTVCKNCNNTFEGKFCNNCGQKADTPRISLHYLWHEIQHGVFHLDKGVLYTFKELFIRPGHTIKDYLNGKRVSHFKPFAYVFILAGILSLLRHYLLASELHVSGEISFEKNDANQPIVLDSIFNYAKSHLAITQLILLPFFAFGSWLTFRKRRYNFIENIILNAFLVGQNLAFNIIFIPVLLLNKLLQNDVVNNIISSVPNMYFIVVMFWGYFQFFNNSNSFKTILKILLTYLIWLIEILLITFLLLFLFQTKGEFGIVIL